MQKLKPCPFCGAEFYKADDDGWLRIDHKPDCYFSDGTTDSWSIQERNIWFFGHWNERHERTCENLEQGMFWCSECNASFETYNDYGGFSNLSNGTMNYCPNCGAKVVGE